MCDHDPAAVRQQRSVALAVAPVQHDEHKINLIDTPGYGDFVGELRAGLRAADAALFVIPASEGREGLIDPATVAQWEECAAVGMPRAVVVARCDHARADQEATIAACQESFGAGVAPLYLPIRDGESMTGLYGLLSQTPAGQAPEDAEDARATLIEGIIEQSEDETLMERYLEGEDIERHHAHRRSRDGRRARHVPPGDPGLRHQRDRARRAAGGADRRVPVAARAPAAEGVGHRRLRPRRRSRPTSTGRWPPRSCAPRPTPTSAGCRSCGCSPARCGPTPRCTSAGTRCVPTQRTSSSDDGGHDADERLAHVYSPLGATLNPVDACGAGDICALTKLGSAETGDTVSASDDPLLLACWNLPEPLLPVAIAAHTRGDEDALVKTLAKIVAADPTLRLERNQETHQTVLWCMGEAHADVVLSRLRAGGAEVDTEPVQVAMRETIAKPARVTGRHVKQSGGHGQYAVCHVEFEPLPRGAGSCSSPRSWAARCPRSTSRASRRACGRSWSAASPTPSTPAVDLKATLVDGKAHSVDSSDAAFQTAGALALREAADGVRGGAAGAGRRGGDPHPGRLPRRGARRPVRPARPGARHRGGRPVAAPWCGPRCPPSS